MGVFIQVLEQRIMNLASPGLYILQKPSLQDSGVYVNGVSFDVCGAQQIYAVQANLTVKVLSTLQRLG